MNCKMGMGYKLLSNIRDTMSYRALTEKHFNDLFKDYRSEILPDTDINNWADLSKRKRFLCSHMNNFFCGLHLLVGIADTCESQKRSLKRISWMEKTLVQLKSQSLRGITEIKVELFV